MNMPFMGTINFCMKERKKCPYRNANPRLPQPQTAAAPNVKLGEGLADAPQTFLPGEYQITVKDAEPRVIKERHAVV